MYICTYVERESTFMYVLVCDPFPAAFLSQGGGAAGPTRAHTRVYKEGGNATAERWLTKLREDYEVHYIYIYIWRGRDVRIEIGRHIKV